METMNEEYWEFSVWFIKNYGHLIFENYYEPIQIVAYHAWMSSRISKEEKIKDESFRKQECLNTDI